jgi:carboxylesterase type B
MFWIYGGGYTSGNSYEFGLYDGKHLSESHNVVVVTVNYRLGNLGFMALDALKQEDPNSSTGNYGVQDQTLGLQWVKRNIAAFGGNPDRVIIFGESAGGFSVMWHLVSPASAGLFHGAIMESGTSQTSLFFQHYKDAAAYYEDSAAILDCPAGLGAAAQLDCLRALPRHRIQYGAGADPEFSAKRKITPADRSPIYPLMPNGPVIDGSRVGTLDVPIRLIDAGNFNKVPLILGANENGGTIFEPMVPLTVPNTSWPLHFHKDSVGKAFDYLLQGNSSRLQEIYNVTEFKAGGVLWPEDALVSRVLRDLMFMCPLRQVANLYAKQDLPAYMYVFHFHYGLVIDQVLHLGDFHAGEVPFVFKNWLWALKALAPARDSHLMADIMSCKWASFAYTLDPNGGDDASKWPPGCELINKRYSSWPRFNIQERMFYSLQHEPEVLQIRSNNYYPDDLFPRDPKCDLIDSISSFMAFRHDEKRSSDAPIFV